MYVFSKLHVYINKFGSYNIHARIIFASWQRAKVVQKQMILRTDHIERPAAKGAKVKNSATCVVGCVVGIKPKFYSAPGLVTTSPGLRGANHRRAFSSH